MDAYKNVAQLLPTEYMLSNPSSPPVRWKRESQVRDILERVYRRPFGKQRPLFLLNPRTGKPLELDCFNEELQLAVEVNGAHHYHYTPFYHGTREQYEYLCSTDELKRQLCAQHGVRLVIVPYTVPNEQLEDYLLRVLEKRD